MGCTVTGRRRVSIPFIFSNTCNFRVEVVLSRSARASGGTPVNSHIVYIGCFFDLYHSGESKPAMEVAKREGRSVDGGKYAIYTVDEETVWERIDSMADWWKESTWNRLVTRELPDL